MNYQAAKQISQKPQDRVGKVWDLRVLAGFVVPNIWGMQLLDQDTDDADEEDEVHLLGWEERGKPSVFFPRKKSPSLEENSFHWNVFAMERAAA